MLDRIPGIDLALGNQNDARVERFLGGTRGLGGSSQILIDGKRLAGKENEARNQLSRIAAAEVQYIEIVRGTSSELDVRNSGQLINIVLREAQTRSSLSAEVGVRRFQDSSIKPEGTFSMTGQRGALSYQISANTSPGYRIEDTFELSLNPDLSFNETVELERIIERTNYNFNSNLTYEPSSENRFALNLLYSEQDPPTKLLRTFTDFSSGLGSISFEREDNPSKANNWEIGGDYEHIFGNGAKYKFLFIVNDRKQDIPIMGILRKIENLYNGTLNKIPPYEALKQQYNLTDDQIAYIGDDLIDIPVMELAGVPIATDNAVPATKEVAVYVTQNGGGYGAFREAVEWLLNEQGRLTEVIDLLRKKVQNQK
mgnify:CR=1 FL=1